MRSIAPWFNNAGILPGLCTWFHTVAIMTQLWLIPLQSIFRYFVIVKQRLLKPMTTVIWIVSTASLAMVIAIFNIIPLLNPSSSAENYMLLKYTHNYDNDSTVLTSFRSIYIVSSICLGLMRIVCRWILI